jgi:hypothetical protein
MVLLSIIPMSSYAVITLETYLGPPGSFVKPGWHSRYRDWLRAGRPRGRSSSPSRVKNFLHVPLNLQWVQGLFSGGKAAGA